MMRKDEEEVRKALENGRGSGVRIAVLDSGVDWTHPAFDGMAGKEDWRVNDAGELVASQRSALGADVLGHGTAVASLIHRHAPDAEIGSFRVLEAACGNRSQRIGMAFREAISRGYDIINCSFGSRVETLVGFYKRITDLAVIKGVHVVAAANEADYRRAEWPAHFSSVFGVRAGAEELGDIVASGYGKNSLIEFVAPGENLPVAWPGGQWKQVTGSSFAAAVFTGRLAAYLGAFAGSTPWQTRLVFREAYSKSSPRRIAATRRMS